MINDEYPECNICIQAIGADDADGGDFSINNSINDNLIKKKITVMKTPCGHLFHP